jgi:hypothetical protein
VKGDIVSTIKGEPLQRPTGSLLTFQRSDARAIVPRLREFLDCDAVWLEKAPIDGEHEWVVLVMAPKFHERAIAFCKGWKNGLSDGLNSHYSRPHYTEELARKEAEKPFDRPPPDPPKRPTLQMIRALTDAATLEAGLSPWAYGSATIGTLKKNGWIEPNDIKVSGGTLYKITEAGTKVLAEARQSR